jgi:fatty-acyl-CoA synthase
MALPARRADTAAYPDELAARVGQVAPHATVVADDIVAQLPGTIAGEPVVRFADLADGTSGTDAGGGAEPDDLAVLQFTSGTTARSRAVALTHGQLMSNVSAMSDALDLSSRDRGLSWLPLFHDMGLLIMIAAAAHPGDLVLLPTEEFGRRPGCWMDTASRLGCTVTVAPSTGYSLATKDLGWRPRELDLSRLRVAGNGAEPVDPAVLAAFVAVAAPYGMSPTAPCPMYGLAEATLAVTASRPDVGFRELWAARDTLEAMQAVRLVRRCPGPPWRSAAAPTCCPRAVSARSSCAAGR